MYKEGVMTESFPGDHKLDLDYPCRWSYTLIGRDEQKIRAAVVEVIGDREHTLAFSHFSKKGTYCSLHLELTVDTEEYRNATYHALHGHADIRIVI